jgi:hypothetical protein
MTGDATLARWRDARLAAASIRRPLAGERVAAYRAALREQDNVCEDVVLMRASADALALKLCIFRDLLADDQNGGKTAIPWFGEHDTPAADFRVAIALDLLTLIRRALTGDASAQSALQSLGQAAAAIFAAREVRS